MWRAPALCPRTACVLINTPNNPSGVVYSAQTLAQLADLLERRSREYGHRIYLVSDEPYRDIVFDGGTAPYPAAFYPHTLTCFSYSKSLSIPGERLGYVAVCPGCEGEEVLVDMMAQISRFTGHNCPPSLLQRAVAQCQGVTSDLSVYQTNMELLYDALTRLGFEVQRPGGTFYIFPKALEAAMCGWPTASTPTRCAAACPPWSSWPGPTADHLPAARGRHRPGR